VTVLIAVLGPKRLELLLELVPNATAIALLINPDNLNAQTYAPAIQSAAKALSLRMDVLAARNDGDLQIVFTKMVQQHVNALMLMPDPFLMARREQLVALAAHDAIPAIYPIREFVEVGGLMSYGTRVVSLFERAGRYTGKILQGTKPADLPVDQIMEFELVINLKTAKALGLAIPPSLLARADEVVE
jgi:putative ABC transport system substrate-binding protein